MAGLDLDISFHSATLSVPESPFNLLNDRTNGRLITKYFLRLHLRLGTVRDPSRSAVRRPVQDIDQRGDAQHA